MRFPKVIRFRRVEATIYGKTANYPFYRLAYYVAGRRVTRSFKSYGEAKTEAEQKVREIADGSQAAALTSEQSRDALAALQRLENFRQSTGRRFSVLAAVSEFVEALEKLKGRSLGEAVEGFLQTVAAVRRKDVAEAVEEFLEGRRYKAKTRQRRLVVICPALAAWLQPCRKKTGKVFPAGVHVFQRRFSELRDRLKVPARKNGLRHAFCTYHFALHANENLTAQQAGNSPAMIHAHYKGLATKTDAEKWFQVLPQKIAKK